MLFKRIFIAGTVAALLSTAVPASGQTSATGIEIPAMGVQFHATWSDYTWDERLDVLDKMAAAGVKWVRVDLGWASFQEGGRGSYSDWYAKRVDRIVDEAATRGIKVLGTIWWTPGWANGGAGRGAPPHDPQDFGNFARWVANRYQGRVAAWEIWNEPNLDDFFTGTAGDYVDLLKAAYPAIKEADPAAQVVLGGPSYNDTKWLSKVYEAGAQGYFDVMSTHPYQGEADLHPEAPDDGTIWRIAHTKAVHALMERYGDGDKKIWFTEYGWSTHPTEPGAPNWMRGVTLEQQADFLVRSLKYIGDKFPYVTNVFWYNERDTKSGNIQVDNYGLLYRDLTPKPSYFAMKTFLTSQEIGSPDPTPTVSPTPTTGEAPPTTPSPDETTPPVEDPGTVDPAPTPAPTAAPDPNPSPTVALDAAFTPTVKAGERGSKPCKRFKKRWRRRHCRHARAARA